MTNWELRKLAAECRLLDQSISHLQDRAVIKNGRVISLNLSKIHLHDYSHFPISIFKMDELRSLNLKYNGLTSLPQEIGKLEKLETLDISFNFIDDIPEEILSLPHLKTLRVRRNHFLPDSELEVLENIEVLDLSSNELDSIPQSVYDRTTLRKLSLASNEITSIRGEIGQLHNLEYLNLRANNISKLPEELVDLHRLHKINIYANPIYEKRTKPLEFRHTPKLFIDYKMQHSNFQKAEVIALTPRILDYRFDPTKQVQFGVTSRGVPLYPILIYGDPEVGKQSIIESYIYDHLIPEDNLVIQQNRYMSWDHYIVNSKQKFFQIWYLHQQHLVGPSHNTNILNGFYYSTAIILVFDVTDKISFRSVLHNIHRIVQIRHQPCPIVVVGNKIESSFRMVEKKAATEILQQVGDKLNLQLDYIETSVVDNINIEEVFSKIFDYFV